MVAGLASSRASRPAPDAGGLNKPHIDQEPTKPLAASEFWVPNCYVAAA